MRPTGSSVFRRLRQRAPEVVPLAVSVAMAIVVAGLLVRTSAGWGAALPFPTLEPVAFGFSWSTDAVEPAQAQLEAIDRLFRFLSLMVLAVGVIALGTVAALLTSRGSSRRRELAVRGAMGAPPRQLARRLWNQDGRALVLGGISLGGILGLVSLGAIRITWAGVTGAPIGGGSVSWVSMLSLLALILALTFLFALSPVRFGHRHLARTLSAGARATADPREGGLRRLVTVLQMAGSLALLTAALLLVRSMPAGEVGDMGGAGDSTLISLRMADGRTPESRAMSLSTVLRTLSSDQEFDSVALASPGAWLGLGTVDFSLAECGACVVGLIPVPFLGERVQHHAVSPGFFAASGTALLDGRDFTLADDLEAPPVAIVNRPFALENFENGDPLGHHVRLGSGADDWYEVIGVVNDPDAFAVGRGAMDNPAVYVSTLQHAPDHVVLAVPGDRSTQSLERVQALASDQGMVEFAPSTSLSELRARAARPMRWVAVLAGFLGVLAMLVALIGVHHVARVEVTARRKELGIRLALGSSLGALHRYVLLLTAKRALAAWIIALPLTVAITAALRESLGEVPLFDASAFSFFAVFLAGAAVMGALRPARAGTRVQPATVLAEE